MCRLPRCPLSSHQGWNRPPLGLRPGNPPRLWPPTWLMLAAAAWHAGTSPPPTEPGGSATGAQHAQRRRLFLQASSPTQEQWRPMPSVPNGAQLAKKQPSAPRSLPQTPPSKRPRHLHFGPQHHVASVAAASASAAAAAVAAPEAPASTTGFQVAMQPLHRLLLPPAGVPSATPPSSMHSLPGTVLSGSHTAPHPAGLQQAAGPHGGLPAGRPRALPVMCLHCQSRHHGCQPPPPPPLPGRGRSAVGTNGSSRCWEMGRGG
mmetsp:Transcript_105085/g.328660  ORF Transcript_105085/g.328660 Transcript_105085/m.328660 type:complete len:261 (+) Transcript_105085:128-910(+)